MAIAPACIDAIVLTHCHYDHTQGLTRILQAIGRDEVPVIAHPDLFRLNFVQTPFLRHVGVMPGDLQPQVESAGGVLFPTRDPLQILPGLMTTGGGENGPPISKTRGSTCVPSKTDGSKRIPWLTISALWRTWKVAAWWWSPVAAMPGS